MGKRKREVVDDEASKLNSSKNGPSKIGQHAVSSAPSLLGQVKPSSTIQIVTGSYERVLHGVTATLSQQREHADGDAEQVKFADTFLFSAHSSAIRCLAVSPSPSIDASGRLQKVILATGGTDERINLYHLSPSPPSTKADGPVMPNLAQRAVMENPKNRELGALLHHSSSVTALQFATRSKLLSSAEDNTISVTRTRDWTMLRTIKAPLPRAHGRPTGDTAPPGTSPAGINDFAVHPSRKLMLSVSKGEKCMRLWNLVTGEKAGVLNFGREILQTVGEGKGFGGEGRKVDWNVSGEEFVVGFERAAIVFNIDCRPKCQIKPSPISKLQQIRYISLPSRTDVDEVWESHVLAISTEDGRIIFYSTAVDDMRAVNEDESNKAIPTASALGQLGGRAVGVSGRIKDFIILDLLTHRNHAASKDCLTLVTGSSDGIIRLWQISASELTGTNQQKPNGLATTQRRQSLPSADQVINTDKMPVKQIGRLLGAYETGNRITCLAAFVLVSNGKDAAEADMAEVTSGTAGTIRRFTVGLEAGTQVEVGEGAATTDEPTGQRVEQTYDEIREDWGPFDDHAIAAAD
ncbi:MAG: hypothetical protein M1816_006744 [Peltula sp. TS41687]|nr:MAG: hypothetical protein M1816_006744 [Peltula sp. TS41687]